MNKEQEKKFFELICVCNNQQQELERYKNRIDIAIEYIKSNLDNTNWLELGSQDVEVLLNILQGSDE